MLAAAGAGAAAKGAAAAAAGAGAGAGAGAAHGYLRAASRGARGRVTAAPGYLRPERGEQAQGLRVPLEAAARQRAAGIGQGRQRGLPVVAERRVAGPVGRAGGVAQGG